MITALLILALIAAVIGTISIVGWCFGQGLFFWIFVGNDVLKVCVAGIAGLLSLLSDANS